MSAELLQLLNGVQTMSIVGMCKNAGKTTMLNWMLHHDRLQGDRKSTRLNSSHTDSSRMPSSA